MLDLHDPVLDFVKMAQGMGVEATRAETTTEFAAQFADAMQHPRPTPDRSCLGCLRKFQGSHRPITALM